MADIKIKETAKTVIKTADNLGIVTEKVKDAEIKTKESINKAVENRSDSPVQYATDKVQEKTKSAAETAVYEFGKQGKNSVVKTKDNIKTAKLTLEEVRERRAAKQKRNTPQSNTSVNTENTVKTSDNLQKRRSKGNTPKKANNAIKTGNPQSVKATERTAKTTAKAGQKAAQVKSMSATKNADKARKAAQHIKSCCAKSRKSGQSLCKGFSKSSQGNDSSCQEFGVGYYCGRLDSSYCYHTALPGRCRCRFLLRHILLYRNIGYGYEYHKCYTGN